MGRDDHVALLHSLTVVYADSTSATWSNQLPFVISARLQSTRVRAHMVQLLASASSYRHRRVHTAQAVPQDRLLRVVRHPLARRSCPITRRTTQPCPTTACAIQPRQVKHSACTTLHGLTSFTRRRQEDQPDCPKRCSGSRWQQRDLDSQGFAIKTLFAHRTSVWRCNDIGLFDLRRPSPTATACPHCSRNTSSTSLILIMLSRPCL